MQEQNIIINISSDFKEQKFDSTSNLKITTKETKNLNKNDSLVNYSSTLITSKDQNVTTEAEDKILYKFEWKEGGKKVLLTGDFVNWKQNFEMIKNNDNTFSLQISLPKKIIQFKFIVDGELRASSNYSTFKNSLSDLNNFIDLTTYSINNKSIKISNNNENNQVININNKQKNNNHYYNQNCLNSNYNLIYPSKDQMKLKGSKLPFHYSFPFSLNYNSNQDKIGMNKYLIYQGSCNSCSENSSYRSIFYAPHININHVLTINDRTKLNKKYIQFCLSKKARNKTTTFVYYKPL